LIFIKRLFNFIRMTFSTKLNVAPRESCGERSRRELLDAALTCFSRDGLEGASVRDIARTAGQNPAGISYHFGSKEGLYHAVMAQAVKRVSEAADRMGRDMEEFGGNDPEAAIRHLKQFFGGVFRVLISDGRGVRFAPLLVREQTRPTATFDLVYEEGIRRTHETVSRLVGIATGRPAGDPTTVVRAHCLLGQFLVLITARETLLRRMGWKNFQGRHTDAVMAVVEENLEVLLRGLRKAKQG
jgi:AcrR family transcriptional regulator